MSKLRLHNVAQPVTTPSANKSDLFVDIADGAVKHKKSNGSVINLETVGVVNNQVLVTQASQLAGALDSATQYFIDGDIDMGTTPITVPEGGLYIQGLGFGISSLFSSENNYDMFITDTFSGDLFTNNLDFTVSGTNSRLFNIDNGGNFGAVEFTNTNFIACTSLGVLSNYRQLLCTNVAWISILDGIEFVGPWVGGIAILTSIALFIGSGVTLFKAGADLVFQGSVRSDMNALSMDPASTLFDFSPTNIPVDGGFSLTNVRASSTTPLPNFPSTGTGARFRNCLGIENTYVGAEWELTGSATTTISLTDTLVKLAGTTTYSEEHWFSNATDNAVVFDSSILTRVKVSGSLSLTGTNNDEAALQIRQWDDSASTFINIGPEYIGTLNGGPAGTRAENISVKAYATLEQNDRIEVWVKNITGTNDITASAGGALFVEERSS